MKNESVFDKLLRSVGDAVADIREKVVEEGWYGRVVNERDAPQAQLNVSWPQAREVQPEVGEHDHDRAADMEMDR
jgi:hypothetical protein